MAEVPKISISPGQQARVFAIDVHSVADSLLVPGLAAGYATDETGSSRTGKRIAIWEKAEC